MQIELNANTAIGYSGGLGCCSAYRYVVLLMGCLANIIGYSDRANLSLAIVPMQRSLALDEAQVGWALGAFFMGYACTQVIGGFLALQVGPKPVLLFAVATWSAATLATPPMASTSLTLLIVARVTIGLGEGLLLPCLHALASLWVPIAERSTAAALMTSGQAACDEHSSHLCFRAPCQPCPDPTLGGARRSFLPALPHRSHRAAWQFLGTVIALLCCGLADWWWPSLFLVFGGTGVIWCVAFAFLVTSTPGENPCVGAAELARISAAVDGAGAAGGPGSTSSTADGEDDKRSLPLPSSSSWGGPRRARRRGATWSCAAVPWRRLLMNQGCCAIFVAHATHNFSWYLLLSWLPKMLADEGASICVAGLLSVLPFLAAFLISNIGACVADRCLLRRCVASRGRGS